MIKLSNISKSFSNHQVLNDVTFECTEGKIIGLIGPSGGGKSVLMKIIAGIMEFDSGEIDYGELTPEDIGLMFQEGALFDSLSVFDNVAFQLTDGNVPTTGLPIDLQGQLADQVIEILARVGLKESHSKYPAQLSGGMKRRISLARTLISNPRLALLDDPTSGLDPIASNVIMKLIKEIQTEMQSTMIIASQDLRRLLPYVDSLVALFDGKIVYQGEMNKEDLLTNPQVGEFINCRYDLR